MKLKKELNAFNIFSIASGAMISSGLFVLPAIVYKTAGYGIIFSYILAGILIFPSLLTQLELATALPKAGGTYFYTKRILGNTISVINGFADWFTISLKSAFALIGIGAFTGLLLPGISEFYIKLIACSFCIFFTCMNLFSLKSSGKTQNIMVIFLLLILIFFIFYGYRVMNFKFVKELSSINLLKVLSTTGMIFISYGGLTKIINLSEEVKNPKKSLPKGGITAFIFVQIIYVLTVTIIIGIVPHDSLVKSLTPVTDASLLFFENHILKNIGLILTGSAAILAFITTANAGIMTASRGPMSMSRDGALPKFIGKLSKKNNIPFVSIIITSSFMLISILLLNIEALVKAASLFMMMIFLMANLSLIVIRFSKVSNYKPSFKSPFFPVLQIISIIIYIILIFSMGLFTILIALSFVVLTLIWFFFYAKTRTKSKSALVQMIENLTGPELKKNETELEKELFDILIERDEIVLDRFDKIIKNAAVLDLDKTITRDELFKLIAEKVSARWNLDKKIIEDKLNEREKLSSTLIYPGVAFPHAIPHVVVAGNNKFDIVLVRNKFGIKWNNEGEVVYTAFCLIGTKDERNFHLRALMYIAQILQDPEFHSNWMKAENEKEMKSVLILTKRKRQ